MKPLDIHFHEHILLYEKDKDELIDEILRLRHEVKEKDELIKTLNKKQPPSKALFPKRNLKKRWKKLGRPEGHPGTTREKPDKIDHTEHQRLEACPDCGCRDLSELTSETAEHVQEDIVPAVVEATKFMRHGYWCPECKSRKRAPYAPFEVPYGYLGPNILIQAVLLKYHYGLSYGKMRSLFKNFCNLKVSTSALAQALQRVSQWLDVEEKVILEAIRSSPYLHIDETGWKIAGINHWLWNFVNERLALYRIRRGRGRGVPEEILTTDYGGIVVSDFLSAYDKSGRKRQRCLVHLERDMYKYREQDTGEESQKAYKKLKRILNDAYRLDRRRKELDARVFYRRFSLLRERLLNFSCETYDSEKWQLIANRLCKHYDEIFTFLEVPGLSSNNNHAERMIRPNVLWRKISFQNMSIRGAEAHEILMSLLQTLRLQNQDPIEFFKKAYLKHRQGNPAPILSL